MSRELDYVNDGVRNSFKVQIGVDGRLAINDQRKSFENRLPQDFFLKDENQKEIILNDFLDKNLSKLIFIHKKYLQDSKIKKNLYYYKSFTINNL